MVSTSKALYVHWRWVLVVSLLPIIGFAYTWSRFAVNIPFWDDLFVIENSVLPINQTVGFTEKLHYWFGWYTQTEHRIVYNRFVFWLLHALQGEVDYRAAMVVGNLSLLGLSLFYFRLFVTLRLPVRYALPGPFLFFGLASYANQFWGMGSLSNFTVLLFVVCCLWFLVQETTRGFGLAVFFALAASLTLGSGLLVWAVGLLVLFFQRRYATLAGWAFLTATTILVYIQGYIRPDWAPDPLKNALNPLHVSKAFTGFLGSVFDVLQPRQAVFTGYELFGVEYQFSVLPLVAGAVLVSFVFHQLWTRLVWPTARTFLGSESKTIPSRGFLIVAGILLFFMVTALAAALNRSGGDLSAVLTSKYKINAICFTLTVYALVLLSQTERWQEWGFRFFLAFSVLWHLAGYVQYLPNVLNTRNALLADAQNFRLNSSWRFYPPGIVTQLANRHTETIERLGYYRVLDILSAATIVEKPVDALGNVVEKPGYLLLEEKRPITPTEHSNHYFLLLDNGPLRLCFPTSSRLNSWSKAVFGQPFGTGITARLYTQNCPPGTYRMTLYDPVTKQLVPLKQPIQIQP
ncbi:MAG: hypothetical protein H7Y12_13370 [Sphingobacteriaceae bacterium]|nr:hypothetical protein [Cytophagaceae bacterium]